MSYDGVRLSYDIVGSGQLINVLSYAYQQLASSVRFQIHVDTFYMACILAVTTDGHSAPFRIFSVSACADILLGLPNCDIPVNSLLSAESVEHLNYMLEHPQNTCFIFQFFEATCLLPALRGSHVITRLF